MDIDWMRFFDLVERLQAVPPGLVELAVRYGRGEDRAVIDVQRELSGKSSWEEPFFGSPPKVNLPRCREFLEKLRQEEDLLKGKQVQATQDLLQVQAARRAFEKTLKQRLRAEACESGSDKWAELLATEEEVVAGLQQLKETGGLELHQFIGEIEQVLHDRERAGK